MHHAMSFSMWKCCCCSWMLAMLQSWAQRPAGGFEPSTKAGNHCHTGLWHTVYLKRRGSCRAFQHLPSIMAALPCRPLSVTASLAAHNRQL